MNVLFLCYYYPPIKSVGSKRNYWISWWLKEFGNEIYVLTTSNNNRLLKEDILPLRNDIPVIAIPTLDYKTMVKRPSSDSINLDKTKWSNRIIIRIIESIPFSILIDLGGLVYILFGFSKAVKLIKEKKIGIVYSSFNPLADHVIGYLLKLRFSKLKWIADFRDPYVSKLRKRKFYPRFHKKFLKRLMKKADDVTTVSDGMANHFGFLDFDMSVIRNGMNLPVCREDSLDQGSSKFRISYTGSIVQGLQTAKNLFDVLERLIQTEEIDHRLVEINYAGQYPNEWSVFAQEYSYTGTLRNRGFISSTAATKLQQQSQINLLLTWSMEDEKGIITSKYYEYVAANRPMIIIIKGEYDNEFLRIFSSPNVYIHVAGQSLHGLSQFILKCYKAWNSNQPLRLYENYNEVQSLTWEKQAHLLNQFVRRID